MPHADLRLIALCDKWVSKNDEITTFPYSWYPQRITFPDEQMVTVPMTRTGDVLVHVKTDTGTALAGVELETLSDVYWNTYGDIDHKWSVLGNTGITDQAGNALLTNLIPNLHVIQVKHPDYWFRSVRFSAAFEERDDSVKVISGETVKRSLELTRKEKFDETNSFQIK